MLKLKIIVGSTRPGRITLPVAEWVAKLARETNLFEVDLVDLAEFNLPIFDEPHHPRLQQYVHQHTKDWSARIAPGDAVIFVTPEYNHSIPSVLKNALDYLNAEWAHRPAGFVSHGGVASGTRAIQHLKQIVTALDMTAVNTAVAVPYPKKYFNDANEMIGDKGLDDSVVLMLRKVAEMSELLKPLRHKAGH